MNVIKKIIGFSFLYLSITIFLISYVYHFSYDNLVNQTIKNKKERDRVFKIAAKYVSSFYDKNKRYPKQEEYQKWAQSYPQVAPYVILKDMKIGFKPYPQDVVDLFGLPTADKSFLLERWDDGNFDYYASWADRTSYVFEKKAYYKFGNSVNGTISIIFIALIIFFLSLLILKSVWPKEKLKGNKKKFYLYSFLFLGLILFLFGYIDYLGNSGSIDKMGKNEKKLASNFHETASYVNSFLNNKRRYPSVEEFTKWSHSFPQKQYESPYNITISYGGYPAKALRLFTSPPQTSFLLTYFDGDSQSYYASWENSSYIELDFSKYHITNSTISEYKFILFVILLTSTFGMLSIKHRLR